MAQNVPDAQNRAAILYAIQGLRNLAARGFYHGATQGLADPTAAYRAASAAAAQQGAFAPAVYGNGTQPPRPVAQPVHQGPSLADVLAAASRINEGMPIHVPVQAVHAGPTDLAVALRGMPVSY